MSLDKVKESVLAEAKARAEQKVREASREAERLLAAGREENGRASAEALREANLRLDRETARERERILHENRLQVLAAKNRVIEEVFRKAKERLASLSDAEYAKLVDAWLSALPPETGGELRVNPADHAKFAARLDDFNRGRSGPGAFTAVIADPRVSSGAVVDGADYHIDCTVERRLDELLETAVGDLAKKLFGA